MRLNQLPQIDGLGDGPSICSTAGRTYHTTFSGTGNCNLCKVCSSFFGQLPSSNKNTHLKQIDSMMFCTWKSVVAFDVLSSAKHLNRTTGMWELHFPPCTFVGAPTGNATLSAMQIDCGSASELTVICG